MTSEYVSLAEFVQIYSLTQGWGQLPALQVEICDWLEATIGDPKRLLQVYRYAGKSMITCCYVAWRLWLDPSYTFLIVSATGTVAKDNSRFIRAIVETHPLCVAKGMRPADSDQWQKSEFTVNRPVTRREPSVKITSIRSGMTGTHADECLGDDVEIDINSRTEEARDEIARAVAEMGSLSDRLLFIGTPWHETTVYRDLEFGQGYTVLKRPVLNPDGAPAMPERHDMEWIKAKEQSMPTGRFRSQYLLEPAVGYETLFNPAMLKVFDEPLTIDEFDLGGWDSDGPVRSFWIGDKKVRDTRAFWDPASGLKNRDASVIAVVAKTAENDVYVLALEELPAIDLEGGTRFEPQMQRVLEVCRAHHCNTVHVETNFVMTLASELRSYAKTKGFRVRVKPSNRSASQQKKQFIADALEPLMKIGRLYIDATVLKDSGFKKELLDFPGSRADDHLDAVAGAIHELIPSRVDVSDRKLNPLSTTPVRRVAEPVVVNSLAA